MKLVELAIIDVLRNVEDECGMIHPQASFIVGEWVGR